MNIFTIGDIIGTPITDITNMCQALTSDYDESHNLDHHKAVFNDAINIATHFEPSEEMTNSPFYRDLIIMVTYASLLHDTIDHKYPDNLEYKRKELFCFIFNNTGILARDIIWIIENISYSKEVKNGYPFHDKLIVQLARDVVSDADKLQAIGKVGLERCRIYEKSINPNGSAEDHEKKVKAHCEEKLLHLHKYIRTFYGSVKALELTEELKEELAK